MSLILLQTSLLRMTGLGVASAPVDTTDPHQLEGPGIHLRWSFPTIAADGSQAEAGWPEDGFTLYRRPAQAPGLDLNLQLPDSPGLLGPDGVLDLPLGGGQLEFDPALLAQTLKDHPRAASDMRVLLDAYPAYFTIRFDDPVRGAMVTCEERVGAGPGVRLAVVRAHDDDDVVDEAVHLGAAKANLVVGADRITHLRVYLDFVEITAVRATLAEATTDDAAWTEIVRLPPPTDWPGARGRIPRAWRNTYEPGFADLAVEVAKLFDSGDATPRWLRADAFTADQPADGRTAPTWTANIQAQLQLFAIDPFLARLLGLLYADTSKDAASGDPFDYLVTAMIDRPDGGDLVGWVCYGLSTTSGGTLEPPTGLTAASAPARVFVPDAATGVLTRTALVALGWDLAPLGAGGPLAGRPVSYDVEAMPDGAGDWALLTGATRVVPAASADAFGEPVYPDALFADTRGAGTHAYRVRAIDIFGRRSHPSDRAQATVADVVGPPPPVNVRVVLIDPLDPYLGADDQALGPGLLVRFDYPRGPWLAGSDVAAFQVHAHLGSQDRSLDWRHAGTWGAAAGRIAAQAPVAGRVTGVAVLTSTGDMRRVRVTTDLQVSSVPPGTLAAGDTEYPVALVAPGRGATFELAWPAQLDVLDPVPGPCTWYPGYEVHIAGFAAPVDPATGTAIGQVAVGAVDPDGNAGRVSLSAGFQAVDRAVPAAPGGFTQATGELVASRPDFYGRSRVTLTWAAGDPSARYQVLRAPDVGILTQLGRDPSEAPGLSPDELRQLGDDPAAEPAFGLLTAAPVSGTTYTDETLAGHAANRYVYRVQSVSASGVPGPLGPASPPVRVPDVVPPAAPRVAGAAGGDGVIALTIAGNREPDADHYVVYRTSVIGDADDVRRMTVAGTAPHGLGAAIVFTDPAPPPRVDLVYRVVCVDTAGNASAASRPVTARCFSTAPPAPPHLSAVRSRDGRAAALRWRVAADAATVLLLRQPDGGASRPISTWLPAGPGAGTLTDTGLDPATGYRYLARAMNVSRVISDSNPVELPGT